MNAKSPWGKKVRGEMPASRQGGGDAASASMDRGGSQGSFGGMTGADSNGISGGGGGGGGRRGSRGGDSTDGGGGNFGGPAPQQGPEVVIRWESAGPMLQATKFELPAPFSNHYAISITGLPPQVLAMAVMGRGGRGRGRDGAPPADAPQTAADPMAEAKARQDRLLHTATLTAKNHDPQTAEVVMQTGDKETLIFGFSKSSLPLTAADKNVEFIMRAGMISFKARFEPKEMMFKGALAI